MGVRHVDQLVVVSRGQAMKGMRHCSILLNSGLLTHSMRGAAYQTAEQFRLGRSTGHYGSFSEQENASSEIVPVLQTTKTRLFATTYQLF